MARHDRGPLEHAAVEFGGAPVALQHRQEHLGLGRRRAGAADPQPGQRLVGHHLALRQGDDRLQVDLQAVALEGRERSRPRRRARPRAGAGSAAAGSAAPGRPASGPGRAAGRPEPAAARSGTRSSGAAGPLGCGSDGAAASGRAAAGAAAVCGRGASAGAIPGPIAGRALRPAISASWALTTVVRSRDDPAEEPELDGQFLDLRPQGGLRGLGPRLGRRGRGRRLDLEQAPGQQVDLAGQLLAARLEGGDTGEGETARRGGRGAERQGTPERQEHRERPEHDEPEKADRQQPRVPAEDRDHRLNTCQERAPVAGDIPSDPHRARTESQDHWPPAPCPARLRDRDGAPPPVNSGRCDAGARWNVADSSRRTRLRGDPGRVARLANADGMKKDHKAWP